MSNVKNLEYYFIKHGMGINEEYNGKKPDLDTATNQLRKYLAILQEQGPFALILYMQSKKEKEGVVAGAVAREISGFLLHTRELTSLKHENDNAETYRELEKNLAKNELDAKGLIDNLRRWSIAASQDIHDLFFFKDVLERILSYALFDAKARKAAEAKG